MIRINLIPYRARRRQLQILQHIVIGGGAVALALLVVAGIHLLYAGKLSSVRSHAAELQQESQELQRKVGKVKDLDNLRQEVQRKLQLVDTLQMGRFRSLETLIDLSNTIPENVWLTGVEDKGDTLLLQGFGESNKAIATFMRALDKTGRFSDVRLEMIERKEVGALPARKFDLVLQAKQVAAAKEPQAADKGKQ